MDNDYKSEDYLDNQDFSYDSFYDSEQERINQENNQKQENKSKIIKKILTVFFVLIIIAILVVIVLFIISKNKDYISDVNIPEVLEKGSSVYINPNNLEITNLEYNCSNNEIATFEENELIAKADGNAVITISYKYKKIKHSKKYNIKVETNDPNKDNANFKVSGNSSKYVNKDVTLTLSGDVDRFTYILNDDGNEKEVKDKKIVIKNEGKNKIVINSYKGNGKETKTVEVLIDKTAPITELMGSNVYVGKTDLEVCVKCNDTLSGCEKDKVCKTFIESKTNQYIEVKDKAGNVAKSEKFNISINRETINCSIRITDNLTGKLEATTTGTAASKKGFNSDYSDNTNTKTVSKAGKYTFYAETQNNTKTSCSIDVKVKTQYRSRSITKEYYCATGLDFSNTCPSTPCVTVYAPKNEDGSCPNGYTSSNPSARNCGKCSSGKAKSSRNNYGSWGSWGDGVLTSSSTLDVETRKYFYN